MQLFLKDFNRIHEILEIETIIDHSPENYDFHFLLKNNRIQNEK
jgi:hypothetical protein